MRPSHLPYPDENTPYTPPRQRAGYTGYAAVAAVSAVAASMMLAPTGAHAGTTADTAGARTSAAAEDTAGARTSAAEDRATAGEACADVAFDPEVSPGDPGFVTLAVTLTNGCASTFDGWTLSFTLPADQEFTAGWSAAWSVETLATGEQRVTAENLGWNGHLAPGAAVAFGMQGTFEIEYVLPHDCLVNGMPCDSATEPPVGPPVGPPPEVTLTTPTDGDVIPSPCPVTVAAEASSPQGEITHVEFYVDGERVATDDTAPYEARVWAGSGGSPYDQSVFARAYDDARPPQHTDSETVRFQQAPPPPAVMILACDPEVSIPAGGSEVVHFQPSAAEGKEVDLVLDGTTRVTAEPSSFVIGEEGQDVTIRAAEGSAGATTTIRAEADGALSATVEVTVVPAVSPTAAG